MAYSNSWSNIIPVSSDPLNTADDQLRRLRLDVQERMDDLVDDWTADPVVPTIPISTLTGTPQVAHVYEGAAESLASGVNTTIAWTQETLDTGTFHDNSTNNSRLTITDAGYYRLYCALQILSGATTNVVGFMEIRKNGSSTVAEVDHHHTGGVTDQTFQIGVIVLAAATDYYEVRFLQSSGDAWTIRSPTEQSYFEIEKLVGTV